MFLLSKLISFINNGNTRSSTAKKNIVALFIIKGSNIGIGLLIVPLVINYLDPPIYGIWITLSSVIAWFAFFNIGLGNGLRNKLAVAFAHEDNSLCKTYISTTYAILSIIIIILFGIFYLFYRSLSWSSLLNSGNLLSESELSNIAIIVFNFFCLRLILQLISSILLADQRTAMSSLFDLISKVLLLISIVLLKFFSISSFQLFAALSSGLPVFVLIVATVWLFSTRYKAFSPSFSFIDFKMASSLLNLGFKFFFIQIAALLLYQSNIFIIAQLFGPEQVTPYNVAFKYFSVLLMGFSIILAPFWSAFTNASASNEFAWISKIILKLKLLWMSLVFIAIVMLLLSDRIYVFWVGRSVIIPFHMSLLVCMWIIINAWNGIYGHLLNGLGKIKLQLILGLSAAIANIPLAIFLGKSIGISGVLLANIIVLLPSIILYPIQANKLLSKSASGIWDK